jgi:FkbM family methyltransferase
MKYHSQHDEEKYIIKFFENQPIGKCLDIGAYHPETFSNTYELIQNGWSAVLVEPSPECFKVIDDYYKGNTNIQVVNKAIADEDGLLEFWNSAGANATAVEEHYNIWKNLQKDYQKIIVEAVSWETFYKQYPGIYDFISIDAEGMDYDILKQINLNETGTKLLCVEYNYHTKAIIDYVKRYNFKTLLYSNGENILLSKGEIYELNSSIMEV